MPNCPECENPLDLDVDEVAFPSNPWVPVNGPSIDDLADEFDFGHHAADEQFPW